MQNGASGKTKAPDSGAFVGGDDLRAKLCLYDFAALDAAGADANLFRSAFHLGLDRAEIDVPAPLGDVVRVRDVVTELRAFAADIANLSHNSLQKS